MFQIGEFVKQDGCSDTFVVMDSDERITDIQRIVGGVLYSPIFTYTSWLTKAEPVQYDPAGMMQNGDRGTLFASEYAEIEAANQVSC